jgi:hypothetical protein
VGAGVNAKVGIGVEVNGNVGVGSVVIVAVGITAVSVAWAVGSGDAQAEYIIERRKRIIRVFFGFFNALL